MTISILFSCFRHSDRNFLTWARIGTRLCQNAFQTIPVKSIFDEKKFVSPRFFGLGNHFWSFWAGFGSSSQKWTSSSTSSQFFALDGPIMSSVGPKLGENISVCALWTRHIVLLGKDTLSPVETDCGVSKRENPNNILVYVVFRVKFRTPYFDHTPGTSLTSAFMSKCHFQCWP